MKLVQIGHDEATRLRAVESAANALIDETYHGGELAPELEPWRAWLEALRVAVDEPAVTGGG